MYSANNENQLILPNIDLALQDYVSIQLDIDNTRIKAAALLAQNVDLRRLIGKENVSRLVETFDNELSESDEELLDLIIPSYCYFTYSRLLLTFHGSYTESGYTNEELSAVRNEAKSVSKEMKAIAESLMEDAFEFLRKENPNDVEVDESKLTPRIRVFGGCENRASN